MLKVVEAKKVVTWHFYFTKIMPIGFFMAATLHFGNLVYLHLTVAFIQMLKVLPPLPRHPPPLPPPLPPSHTLCHLPAHILPSLLPSRTMYAPAPTFRGEHSWSASVRNISHNNSGGRRRCTSQQTFCNVWCYGLLESDDV